MRLTQLEPDPRSGGVRVHLDGRPFGTLAPSDVLELRLDEGTEITERAAEDLALRAEAWSARVVAMRMLQARALSAFEIKRRLLRKGHARAATDAALEALRDAGLINDLDFARHYARTRARRQRFGPRRLLADLRRMGVAEKEAASAVQDALEADGVDARELLREAAAKKARSLSGLDPVVARRRLRSYLLRRGFNSAEVNAVVKDALPR